MKKKRLLTKKIIKASSTLIFSFFSIHAVADIKFEVTGLEKLQKDNVNAYLETIPQSERKQSFHFQSRVKDKIAEALQAVGYFQPEVTFTGEKTSLLGDTIVLINIDAGKPILIMNTDIKILGEAMNDAEFSAILASAPKVGEVLNQGSYDDLKANIQRLSVNRGYFDGVFTQAKLEIAPSLNEANIYLHFDSGQRYKYGQITYNNSQINLERIDSFRDFSEGDPYLVSDLGELNQSLSSTGWFSSALVEADIKNAQNAVVPLEVNFEPAPRNLFETGIGYSTNTGARFKASWLKPWFNSRGHSIDTDFYLSKPVQTLETSYRVPLQDVQHEYYQFQLGLENKDLNNTNSLDLTAFISRHWQYDTGWQRAIFLRWLYSDFTQAGVSSVSNLHLPGVTFSRVRTRGGVMPYWGDRQAITLEVANEIWGSDVDLYRVFGETAWIRSLDEENTHRFLTRVKAGMAVTDNLELVPPSLRFFTGGDNSIRGYSYESISPRDDEGKLIGGKFMTTASLEYNYQFTENWWLAIFADVGDAWTDLDPDWKTSAGLGIRWKSPVGPVRFDVAHGFQNDSDNVMFHFSLGPEL